MKKILKKAVSIAMAVAIAIPVGMGTGESNFTGITAKADWLDAYSVTVTSFTTNSITISWEGDENADNYEISYQDNSKPNSSYKVAGETTDTSYTITGLKSGNVYDICVKPRNAMGDEGFTYCYGAKTKISSIRGLKQDTWYHYEKSTSVSWERLYAAGGYEYKWKSPSGKVLKKGTTTSTSMSFKIKNNNVYQFTVRAYQTVNGKKIYTPWKTIQVFEQPWVKSLSVKKTKKGKKYLSIGWYKQTGATGYDVYVAKKNKRNSYKKVKSVGKKTTKISLSKFNGKKISGKYYVYIISKVKDKNGTSKSGVTYIWETGKSGHRFLG